MPTDFGFHLISAKQLYDKKLPKIEYLVDKLIIDHGITYIVGPAASFKTSLLMDIAIHGATRSDILGFKINKPFKTLFIDEENGEISTKDSLVKILNGSNIDIKELEPNKLMFATISGFLIIDKHIEVLKELIKKYQPDLIIIDNIARCFHGDERNEEDVSKILALLKPITEEFGTAFVIIHHTRKGDAKTLEDISGSRDFGAQCDNAFLLKQCNKKNSIKTFMIKQLKSKHGLEMDTINFSVEGNDTTLNVKFAGIASENIKSEVDKIELSIMNWIIEDPSNLERHKTGNIIEYSKTLGHKKTSTTKAIANLKFRGVLK